MKRNFEGKTVVVTGGSSGIGNKIVNLFAEQGASVIIVDRNFERGNSLEKDYKKNNRNVLFLEQDLYETKGYKEIINFAIEHFMKIDILVNCAGIYPTHNAFTITEEEWDSVFNLNLKVPFFLSRDIAKYMVDNKIQGSIINIGSTASKIPRPNISHYAASKAGLVMLTRALALEWAPYKVRVNTVGPGVVETENLLSMLTTPESKQLHQAKISKIPMKQATPIDEIAEAVIYFADNEVSSYVTGQTIYIDGGYTAGQNFS